MCCIGARYCKNNSLLLTTISSCSCSCCRPCHYNDGRETRQNVCALALLVTVCLPDCCSLEALEKFIQSQKDVLARTNSDIERLKSLRKDVVADPPRSVESLCEKVCAHRTLVNASNVRTHERPPVSSTTPRFG